MELPLYSIGDQVIFKSSEQYFLGIIKECEQSGESWAYAIPIRKTIIVVQEKEIKGRKFNLNELTTCEEKKLIEEKIVLD